MKAATAKAVLADLGNVVGNSDLSSEYLKAALLDTENVVSAVFTGEKAVAAVVWRRQRKGLRIIAAAGTGGHATNLVAALEESWQLDSLRKVFLVGFFIGVRPCCKKYLWREGFLTPGFFHWR